MRSFTHNYAVRIMPETGKNIPKQNIINILQTAYHPFHDDNNDFVRTLRCCLALLFMQSCAVCVCMEFRIRIRKHNKRILARWIECVSAFVILLIIMCNASGAPINSNTRACTRKRTRLAYATQTTAMAKASREAPFTNIHNNM